MDKAERKPIVRWVLRNSNGHVLRRFDDWGVGHEMLFTSRKNARLYKERGYKPVKLVEAK